MPGGWTWRARCSRTRQTDPVICEVSSTVDSIKGPTPRRRILDAAPLWIALLTLVALVTISELGPAQTTTASGSWEVSLSHSLVTRAGQPVPLEIEVRRTTPIDTPVILRVCATWFDAMDFQNWYPNPASETRSADTLVYEFDPPQGRTLTVAFDGRSAPGALGASLPCTVSVTSGGEEIFATSLTTWRMP